MAKTTKNAGKRATAAGRSRPPARQLAAPKSPGRGSRKPKPAKPKPARSTPRKPKPSPASETAALKVELKAAQGRQRATAEVLQVVSKSPGELGPVFRAVLENATRLCNARFGTVHRFDGKAFYFVADVGTPQALAEYMRRPGPLEIPAGGMLDRIQKTRQMQHTHDYAADAVPGLGARLGGARSTLGVPILRDDVLVGAIVIYRQEVRPFSEREIDLVRSFAAQAVIAIENTRLFNETKEALERQTATADVLKVISRSAFDLDTVLNTLAETVTRLCRADSAAMYRRRDDKHHLVASCGLSEEEKQFFRSHPVARGRGTLSGRVELERRAVQIPDVLQDPEYAFREGQKVGGYRTFLGIPLQRENELIGHFNLARTRVEPFTDKEIELATAFADQAVIAIENVRLFNETQQALERQTATAAILQVIAGSPSDVQPVFDAVADRAMSLLDCWSVIVLRFDGEFLHFGAARGALPDTEHVVRERYRSLRPDRADLIGRSLLDGAIVNCADAQAEPEMEIQDYARKRGLRAVLVVPLRREDRVDGVLVLTRAEPGQFAAREVELVQTFADQAVIAIENARLFDEVQTKTRDLEESLHQQTATADVLKTISRSTFDLQVVLDTLTESAARLCEADMASMNRQHPDGDGYYNTNMFNFSPDWINLTGSIRLRPGRGTAVGRALLTGKATHIADVLADPEYTFPEYQRYQQTSGFRTVLAVPLMRAGTPIGVIFLVRKVVKPFTEKQIELLTTFADQAVIAIENARLFNETQEALERQTATSDILKVIASSPSDVQPVFDAIASSAKRLIGGFSTAVHLVIDDMVHLVAFTPTNPESDRILVAAHPRPRREVAAVAMVENGETAQIADSEAADAHTRQLGRARGWRSVTLTPLMNRGNLIGFIASTRRETGVLAEHQVQLLRTFADQAVIAIQNARLFNETKEALEQQTATSDILAAINNSGGFLAPVFECILEKAHQLCGAPCGSLQLYQDDRVQPVAIRGMTPAFAEFLQHGYPITDGVRDGLFADHPVQRIDMVETLKDQPDEPSLRAAVELGGIGTMASVPLLKDGAAFGRIIAARQEVRPFDDKQLATLQGFAAQAVIAIENARLLNELRARTDDLSESLEQQTATADVLKVISRSAFDLNSVLETLVTSATKLCEAEQGCIFIRDDDCYRLAQNYGCSPEFEAFAKANPLPLGGGSTTARAGSSGGSIQVVDVLADESRSELVREYSRLGDVRTLLSVTLRREGETIGVFTLSRREVRAFSQRQIDLVETFADQAVIALENTRLFSETQEALERQTATADILKVIASSPSDAQPVFQAIADRSNRLVDALSTTVFRLVDGVLHLRAFTATTPEADAKLQALFPARLSTLSWGEAIAKAEIYSVIDAEREPGNLRDVARERGWRSALLVPLLRDGKPIGIIGPTRAEPGPFSEHHVQLMQTFADQAVIAIQNVELFEKVQARTRELSLSLEELRTAQDRLIQTEKLASLGQLTAGIAHEIKNPLNFVNNFSLLSTELIGELNDALKAAPLDGRTRDEIGELTAMLKGNLEKVVQHGKRADSIVKNMLLHSREGAGEHRPADINAIVEESLNLAYHGARAEKSGFNITLSRDLDPAAGVIELYPQEITRVLLNLISNGFYAATRRNETGDDGFEPSLRATTKDLGSKVEIRIRDNGTGIPADVKEKMFNPFFTTKPAGEGTGLGLSMSHDIIVKQHGGKIEVDTEPGQFTEFIITLPRAAARAGGRK